MIDMAYARRGPTCARRATRVRARVTVSLYSKSKTLTLCVYMIRSSPVRPRSRRRPAGAPYKFVYIQLYALGFALESTTRVIEKASMYNGTLSRHTLTRRTDPRLGQDAARAAAHTHSFSMPHVCQATSMPAGISGPCFALAAAEPPRSPSMPRACETLSSPSAA